MKTQVQVYRDKRTTLKSQFSSSIFIAGLWIDLKPTHFHGNHLYPLSQLARSFHLLSTKVPPSYEAYIRFMNMCILIFCLLSV